MRNPAQENEALRRHSDRLIERIRVLERLVPDPAAIPASWGLTQLEGKVLGALMKRERMSHEQIMIALYGYGDNAPGDSIIRVMVSRIRTKLKAKILNVWGFGYEIPADERRRLNALLEKGLTA